MKVGLHVHLLVIGVLAVGAFSSSADGSCPIGEYPNVLGHCVSCEHCPGKGHDCYDTCPDVQAPVLTCPNITTSTDLGLNTSSMVAINPNVTDNMDPSPDVNCSHNSSSVFDVGVTNVTCRATDQSGNNDMCSFTATVEDREAPQLECHDIFLTDKCMTEFIMTVHDNVDPTPTATCSRNASSVFPVGNTTVNCHSVDAAGNKGSCYFTVVKQDVNGQGATIAIVVGVIAVFIVLLSLIALCYRFREGIASRVAALIDHHAPTRATAATRLPLHDSKDSDKDTTQHIDKECGVDDSEGET